MKIVYIFRVNITHTDTRTHTHGRTDRCWKYLSSVVVSHYLGSFEKAMKASIYRAREREAEYLSFIYLQLVVHEHWTLHDMESPRVHVIRRSTSSNATIEMLLYPCSRSHIFPLMCEKFISLIRMWCGHCSSFDVRAIYHDLFSLVIGVRKHTYDSLYTEVHGRWISEDGKSLHRERAAEMNRVDRGKRWKL